MAPVDKFLQCPSSRLLNAGQVLLHRPAIPAALNSVRPLLPRVEQHKAKFEKNNVLIYYRHSKFIDQMQIPILPVHAIPGWLYSLLLQLNPTQVISFLICLFGLICGVCEAYLYCGVLCKFRANVGGLCLALLVSSAGMFVAGSALLPSTTSIYLALLPTGA